MWNLFFSMCFSGMIITAIEDSKVWYLIFFVFMMICVIGQVITENKQEERIKKLEKKVEEMAGEDK